MRKCYSSSATESNTDVTTVYHQRVKDKVQTEMLYGNNAKCSKLELVFKLAFCLLGYRGLFFRIYLSTHNVYLLSSQSIKKIHFFDFFFLLLSC